MSPPSPRPRESSEWLDVDKLPHPPEQLTWHDEVPHPDYKVRISFAYCEFEKYRRVTFPNGDAIYARMIPAQKLEPSPDARRGWLR